jgi:hypothetical protein
MRIYLNETKGDLLLAIGNYHSADPALNEGYQKKILKATQSMFGPQP